jgi:hypothetical protein
MIRGEREHSNLYKAIGRQVELPEVHHGDGLLFVGRAGEAPRGARLAAETCKAGTSDGVHDKGGADDGIVPMQGWPQGSANVQGSLQGGRSHGSPQSEGHARCSQRQAQGSVPAMREIKH